MPERADAHAHFFFPGYVDVLPESCRRSQPSEISLYEALREKHSISHMLAIGYEGMPFASGNNRYIAELARSRPWIRPTAYVHDPAKLEVETLESWRENGFVGVSFYLLSALAASALNATNPQAWAWLEQRRWLISVNSKRPHWSAWLPILERFPKLRVLVSHLGLPPAVFDVSDIELAKTGTSDVASFSRFPGVRIKLSAFYAIAAPSHAYPHRAAWPYVESLLKTFGSARLLWGSDFSPSLEHVSFPQTYALFDEMPFLSNSDRQQIIGVNLIELLNTVR